jgi:hypothetical protein
VVITAKKPATKKQSAKKPGSKTQKKTKGQAESDSSDDSDLEIEAPDEPSPLPLTRPNDPIDAAVYDTMQAVWSPRNKWPTADKVKGALVAFKDVIKVLRDAWKDQVQAMKLAENQGDNAKAARLKESVALQRRIMDRIVDTTLTVGHPTIVEKYASPILNFVSPPTFPRGFYGHRSLKRIENFTRVNPFLWSWTESQLIWLDLRARLTDPGFNTSDNVRIRGTSVNSPK